MKKRKHPTTGKVLPDFTGPQHPPGYFRGCRRRRRIRPAVGETNAWTQRRRAPRSSRAGRCRLASGWRRKPNQDRVSGIRFWTPASHRPNQNRVTQAAGFACVFSGRPNGDRVKIARIQIKTESAGAGQMIACPRLGPGICDRRSGCRCRDDTHEAHFQPAKFLHCRIGRASRGGSLHRRGDG